MYAGGGRDVLDADRHTVQRAERLTLHHRVFGAPGGVTRLVGGKRDDGVDLRIERFDCGNVSIEHLDRTYGARRNQPRQFACGGSDQRHTIRRRR